MPKVLYYGSSTQIHSGACQWMYRLADEMRNLGYQTVAVLPDDGGIASWYEESNIQVEYMWSRPLRRRRSLVGQLVYLFQVFLETFQLMRLISDENVDIVHVNEVVYLPGLFAGKLSGARTVCHVRASFESNLIRKVLSGIVLVCSDRVICVSGRTADVMFTEVGYNREQIDVIYDGLPSPERFEDSTSKDGETFRDSIEIGSDDFLVVCISKLVSHKGQDRVLEIASSVSDVTFAIVGGEVDGHETYAEELRERADSIPNVYLTGFYPDIVEVLAAADIVVHVPRYDDPFPGVVLEAMIAGKPVIGSRNGGIPEQIIEGETGYLIDDTQGTGDLIEHIRTLKKNPDLRRSLGENGREVAYQNYDSEMYFESISKLYCSLS